MPHLRPYCGPSSKRRGRLIDKPSRNIVAIAQTLLPEIDKVPENVPAVVLWHFRVASLGMQLPMWTTLGFG